MIVLPQRFLYSMGAGAATVSLLAAAGALFADPRDARAARRARERPEPAPRRRRRRPAAGAGSGVARTVMRRPVPRRAGGHAGPRDRGIAARARDARPAGQPVRAGGPRRAHGHRHDRRRVHAEHRLADHARPSQRPRPREAARARSPGSTGCARVSSRSRSATAWRWSRRRRWTSRSAARPGHRALDPLDRSRGRGRRPGRRADRGVHRLQAEPAGPRCRSSRGSSLRAR